MITVKQNGYLILEHLSNIELYYTPPELVKADKLILSGDEFHHSANVMRNSVGDFIVVTDGIGSMFTCKISKINVNQLSAEIVEKKVSENKSKDIWFCVPVLKNPDRLKFALEKCVELGVTNFILFTSKHTIPKKINPGKFYKTALAAMKQSLRFFLPAMLTSTFDDIVNFDGQKILFEQKAEKIFNGVGTKNPTYFLFGPEGGFDYKEIESIGIENSFQLSSNRLRSETAVIKCASLLKL